MHAEDLSAIRALRAGAAGYIQKESAPEQLLVAIRLIAAGGTYLSPAMAKRIAEDVARGGAEVLRHERLSDREFEIFRLLGSGQASNSREPHDGQADSAFVVIARGKRPMRPSTDTRR
jgi:two-component system, NarL family, invasion response regulator UvrY